MTCDGGGIGIRARLRGVSERVRVQVPSIAPKELILLGRISSFLSFNERNKKWNCSGECMKKYTIGVDFGTLAVRAVLVDISNGEEICSAEMSYKHGVMTEILPDGTRLKPDWALQHPQDYLDAFSYVTNACVRSSDISIDDIVGLGVDFTSSTTLPVDEQGNPLCLTAEYHSNPYSWPMLWKHHAAQAYANQLTQIAREQKEPFLERCGGRISAEMMFPRLWQIANEAPEVYKEADRFVEAGDWITQLITGGRVCSENPARYKLFWTPEKGYPSDEFWSKVDDRLVGVSKKLGKRFAPAGSRAGELNEYGALLTGLHKGTAVSVTCIDAHTALPSAGVTESGKLLLILGTSAAHLILAKEEKQIAGLLCMARDGIIPGWIAYEAGQSCCGDHFKWFVDHCVPETYERESYERNITIHELLTQKASKLQPGQSGLLALDWWGGNRSVLMDSELSGLILGMTLQTKPEEIYRALIEATAFGTRVIVEQFEKNGIAVNEIDVCGGIARKNNLLMQIYADVLKRPLRIVRSHQANAHGAAVFAASAAGECAGGYASVSQAAHAMGGTEGREFTPIHAHSAIYDLLFAEYLMLHDCFGKQGNDVMHRLKELKRIQNI